MASKAWMRIIAPRKNLRKEQGMWLRPEPLRVPIQKGQRKNNIEKDLRGRRNRGSKSHVTDAKGGQEPRLQC